VYYVSRGHQAFRDLEGSQSLLAEERETHDGWAGCAELSEETHVLDTPSGASQEAMMVGWLQRPLCDEDQNDMQDISMANLP
jgi:hypothetical protein